MKLFDKSQLAIAPINWSNDDDPSLGGDISFEDCISQMSQCGYSGTEVGNKFPKDPAILLPMLEKKNLKISSAWFSTYFVEDGKYQSTLEQFMHFLSFMKSVNADVINICDCSHAIQQTSKPVFSKAKPEFNEKEWEILIKGLHAIGRIAYDYQIKIAYHYHLGTGIQNGDEIDFLMEHTSPQLVGLLLDTGHAYCADVSSDTLLEKYGNRINNVHLKDVRNNIKTTAIEKKLSFMDAVRAGIFTVPGDGCIDFKPILQNLAEKNYKGWLVVEAEQDPNVCNPLIYANSAHQYISKIIES